MILDYQYATIWLNKLKKYWFEKDIDGAISLFKNTSFYQETPFMKPFESFDEIANEWQNIKSQNIIKIEFEILAIDKNVLIAHWYFEREGAIFDGIYEIKFNENLECIYFKSWEMQK